MGLFLDWTAALCPDLLRHESQGDGVLDTVVQVELVQVKASARHNIIVWYNSQTKRQSCAANRDGSHRPRRY